MEDDRTRRWERTPRPERVDPSQALRALIKGVRVAPRDPEARRRLRALAAEQGLWEQLALLLGDEARAAERPEVAAACFEELADVFENLDRPLEMIEAMEAVIGHEPGSVEHHDRIAWLYRKAGAWAKAAAAFERVGELAQDDRGRAALRAAGQLYREHGRLAQAAAIYRTIVTRRPADADAWRSLDDVLAELGRWAELAEVRGDRAAHAKSGLDKAALLRSQARALEQAGELAGAARVVAEAAHHAPEDVSGLVDYADVLARSGQGREAADILAARVGEAVDRGASAEDVAALRSRLAGILEDSCGDRPASVVVLEELLAAMPAYLPALERITAIAAADPDPRVHAAALLRYAAALPSPDPAILLAAARRYREAGDHSAAARAFEAARELVPTDKEVRRELDDARTAVIVERAIAEAAAGDAAGAERRLHTILATSPHHVEANLALAEILTNGGRLEAAAEHLQETLASAPEGTPGERLARLVHRYAITMGALGDADDHHQLLHEAHRLDRRDLAITLALGESCFARRLWREAARHLGSLAEHPGAARHAGVAAALVHAAQAEVRALRPANAAAHYEAAVRLDPGHGPAWHALAELAVERGELVRAAECLEREATSTTDPRDRTRLFDALGDMAIAVLGDPARAERCWSQVASEPVLDKLLALQRGRGATVERGETCERLGLLVGEPQQRKALFEEAVDAFAAGGELVRARQVAERLIASYPLDDAAVACATSIALDPKRASAWLRRALGAWDAAGDRGDRDPRRAELWRRLGDAERAIGNAQPALKAYQRAVAVAPASAGALGARRGLVELATGAQPTTSSHALQSSLFALVEAEQDPADVLAWARGLARTGSEDARAAFELALAVGAPLADDDRRFLAEHPTSLMASDEGYAAALDDGDRRQLIDDPADAPLGELLELLAEVVPLVCPDARTALFEADVEDARRMTAASRTATMAMYPQIAKLLGGPAMLLYATPRADAPDLRLLLAAPPIIVVGPRLATLRATSRSELDLAGDTALRFRLGRLIELARPRRLFAAGTSPDAFGRLIGGLCHAFGRPAQATPPAREVVAEGERLHSRLTVVLRKRIAERLAQLSPELIDPVAYLAGCQRAADRAGLLACGDLGAAIELAGGPTAARHLVQLGATERYLEVRRKLRARPPESRTAPFVRR